MRNAISILLTSALVTLTSSCATDPKPFSIGQYGLQTIAGAPLPQVAWETETIRARLVADTMDFKADGTGVETVQLRFESKGPALEEPGQTELVPFTYTVTGSAIAISYVCPDLASCAPPPHYVGTITNGRISLDSKMTTSGTRVFEKKPIEG